MKFNAGTVGLAQNIKNRMKKIVLFRKTKKVNLVSVCTCCQNEY